MPARAAGRPEGECGLAHPGVRGKLGHEVVSLARDQARLGTSAVSKNTPMITGGSVRLYAIQ